MVRSSPILKLIWMLWPILTRLFFSSRRRHTGYIGDWSSDVCSSDLLVRFDGWEQNRKVAADLEQLSQRYQGHVKPALARRLQPTRERLADYLLAVREAFLERPTLLKDRKSVV